MIPEQRVEIISLADSASLARTAARRFIEFAESKRLEQRPVSVALSGGRIAIPFFSAVVLAVRERALPGTFAHFFWADERCVPPAHPESNFRLARENLFLPAGIDPNQIHRIPGERNPVAAAQEAALEMKKIVPVNARGLPVLDLILLGMGEDGHVASLFPGEPDKVLQPPDIYRAVLAPKPPSNRITLNYSVIAAAREVWALVSGSGKERALRESLAKSGTTPLAKVLADREKTVLFTDILIVLPTG